LLVLSKAATVFMNYFIVAQGDLVWFGIWQKWGGVDEVQRFVVLIAYVILNQDESKSDLAEFQDFALDSVNG
jgi:predicted small integral membrane protein